MSWRHYFRNNYTEMEAAQKSRYSLRIFSPNIWSLSCICTHTHAHTHNWNLMFPGMNLHRSTCYEIRLLLRASIWPTFQFSIPHHNPHINFSGLSTRVHLSCSVLLHFCNFVLLRVSLASQQFISASFVFEGPNVFDLFLAVLFQIHCSSQLHTLNLLLC